MQAKHIQKTKKNKKPTGPSDIVCDTVQPVTPFSAAPAASFPSSSSAGNSTGSPVAYAQTGTPASTDENDAPTTHHRSSPTSPFVGRAVLAAYDTAVVGTNCGEVLLTLAAMLSSEDPFVTRAPKTAKQKPSPAVPPQKKSSTIPEKETLTAAAAAVVVDAASHHWVTTWPSLIRVFDAYITSGEDPQWCRRNNPRLRSLRAARSIREQLVEVVRGLGSCCRSNSDLPGRVHRGGGSSGGGAQRVSAMT
ncbi:hypothetical protein HK405_011386 [Cladochytrium tenue]|nr:hypothetical protein HK405_011386 [Cladochytrium tenue]